MNKLPVARAPVSAWLAQLPSVDKLLSLKPSEEWLAHYGRDEVLRVIRSTLSLVRQECLENKRVVQPDVESLLEQIAQTLKTRATPNLRRVINLTGTVLHTNLGRAVMPPEVIEAMGMLPSISKRERVKHHPAMPYAQIPALFQRIGITPVLSAIALLLCVLTATRTSETIEAKWEEFDFDDAVWTIPKERMKKGCALRRSHQINRWMF